MTISATTTRWFYNGDGATTPFAYDNKILADTDLDVYVGGVLQTLTTDYTVSGAGDVGGGTVTFVSAPGSGTNNVWIERDVPDTQATVFPAAGPFPSASVEDALDKLTILVQQAAVGALVSYTVATVPAANPAGRMIYVTDETDGAVPAFSDGTDWRRVTDRTVVS
jgi:hypothetical protein